MPHGCSELEIHRKQRESRNEKGIEKSAGCRPSNQSCLGECGSLTVSKNTQRLGTIRESKDFLEEEKRSHKGKFSEIRRRSRLFFLFHRVDWPAEMAWAHERAVQKGDRCLRPCIGLM